MAEVPPLEPGAIPETVVLAALRYDCLNRPRSRNWTAPAPDQVRRLLAGGLAALDTSTEEEATWRARAERAEATLAALAAVIPPVQFRSMADWFDADDEFKTTQFPETWPPGSRGHEAQDDLRKFAGLLARAIGSEEDGRDG